MSQIHTSLEQLAHALEESQTEIADRSLSGDKIQGGVVRDFASTGISDKATQTVLTLTDSAVICESLAVRQINNSVNVKGTVTAQDLSVKNLKFEHNEQLDDLQQQVTELVNSPLLQSKIRDRSISGDAVQGGTIKDFASTGILDRASKCVLTIKNDGVQLDKLYTPAIGNDLTLEGSLTTEHTITADKVKTKSLGVDYLTRSIDVAGEITAKGNIQSSGIVTNHVDAQSASVKSTLRFDADTNTGLGLLWSDEGITKQLVLHSDPSAIWSSENIDLPRNKSYMIGKQVVLDSQHLGASVTSSNLKKLGNLSGLQVSGNVDIDGVVQYNSDTEQFSIGVEDPAGMFSIGSLDHQFFIDYTEQRNFKLGTWSTSGLDFVTDDTARISIANTGKITVNSAATFNNSVAVGVKNPQPDADLTVAGNIRFCNKKHTVASRCPSEGSFIQGDIVWNDNPQPTGYVGWVCTRSGTPGEWRAFGAIA